jgi:large subunit ribosomal protein L15
MKLNEIRDNDGAHAAKTRVGRGIGSGKGKTAGSGHKGQLARSGVALRGFEGGQMPLYRRLPKRGFNNHFKSRYAVINLRELQKAVDSGKLDSGKPITEDVLRAAGLLRKSFDGIRVLGQGDIKAKVALEVSGASKSAVAAIEKAGGTIKVTVESKRDPDGPKKGKKAKAKKAAPAEDKGGDAPAPEASATDE